MRPETASFIFEHVFLPPNLPSSDHEERGADDLLNEVSEASFDFLNSLRATHHDVRTWEQLSQATLQWIEVYDKGKPTSGKITAALRNMSDGGSNNRTDLRIN